MWILASPIIRCNFRKAINSFVENVFMIRSFITFDGNYSFSCAMPVMITLFFNCNCTETLNLFNLVKFIIWYINSVFRNHVLGVSKYQLQQNILTSSPQALSISNLMNLCNFVKPSMCSDVQSEKVRRLVDLY